MTRITQQQLESYLWGAATILRGTIDAGDYKQFIFPLLFFKRLCDVFDEETLIALRESDGDQDFALFPENHRFQVPTESHWKELRKVSRDVGGAIQRSMRAIETANQDKLFGIFGDAQWSNKDRLSDAMLRDLVEHFSSLELSVANLPEDELGQGYEFLIKKFADDAGHTAAEFYTNRTVVHLMTEILDVQPGESVYDPTCGSGGMLLSCIAHLKKLGKEYRNVRLYGQERNLMTSSIARMNCFLHGIEDFRIERGDTLAEPKFVEGDRLMRFDVVLANPPYSIKQWDRAAFTADPWGRNLYGTPPQGRADYAFQQHILQSLRAGTGRCAVLWPHGVLFRQEEAEMRRKMIEADLVECVIGLGPNLFYNSAMDSCVVVCRTNKPKNRRGKILLIDAKEEVTRERTQSFLTPEHLARIIQNYRSFEGVQLFSRVVSISEVRANNGNLNIALYIDSTPKSGGGTSASPHDLDFAFQNWTKSAACARAALAALVHENGQGEQKLEAPALKIGVPEWIDRSEWMRVRLGDVAVRDAGKIEPDGATVHRWVAADHIDEGDIHVRRWSDTNDPLFPPTFRFTFKAGNVLLHSRNPKKVVIPRFDGITGEKLFVLKARNNDVLREDFLAFILMSEYFGNWVSQWMSGSVNKFLNWSAFEKFEFDLPPLEQQRRIADLLWTLDRSFESSAATIRSARTALDSESRVMFSDDGPQRWPMLTASNFCRVQQGQVDPKESPYSGMIHIAPDDIEIETGRILELKTAAEDNVISGKYEFNETAVLYSKIRPNLRKVAFPGFAGVCSADIYPVYAQDNILPGFLFHLLLSEHFTKFALMHSARSAFPKLNREALFSYRCRIPSLDEQRMFLNRVGCIASIIDRLASHTDSLSCLNLAISSLFFS